MRPMTVIVLSAIIAGLTPTYAHAVLAPEWCEYIIPYQWGAGTNAQMKCYKFVDAAHLVCISGCKAKCNEMADTCHISLDDRTKCYMGCDNGPILSNALPQSDAAAHLDAIDELLADLD